jgi:hypothetical protein
VDTCAYGQPNDERRTRQSTLDIGAAAVGAVAVGRLAMGTGLEWGRGLCGVVYQSAVAVAAELSVRRGGAVWAVLGSADCGAVAAFGAQCVSSGRVNGLA